MVRNTRNSQGRNREKTLDQHEIGFQSEENQSMEKLSDSVTGSQNDEQAHSADQGQSKTKGLEGEPDSKNSQETPRKRGRPKGTSRTPKKSNKRQKLEGRDSASFEAGEDSLRRFPTSVCVSVSVFNFF